MYIALYDIIQFYILVKQIFTFVWLNSFLPKGRLCLCVNIWNLQYSDCCFQTTTLGFSMLTGYLFFVKSDAHFCGLYLMLICMSGVNQV